ncbi:Txe/YoeB family addiction module toxin [Runella limosa]|uniref:Txe/YoeB family addiction module toxin n=1 Tax=Runella limosa TaxID=370978 RepID=UPI0004038ED4|nr:Txe/YoeB family addiction module toxin [Runella limosa]
MRKVEFDLDAFEQLSEWASTNKKVHSRICRIIVETARNPFEGIGKTEPLKGNFAGCWSRRITDEHRMVYKVYDNSVRILALEGHYE